MPRTLTLRSAIAHVALIATLMFTSLSFVSPIAHAQDMGPDTTMTDTGMATAQVDPATERSTEFVAVQGAPDDGVPGGKLMIAAYIVVWVLVFGYLLRLGAFQGGTRKQLEQLSERIGGSKG